MQSMLSNSGRKKTTGQGLSTSTLVISCVPQPQEKMTRSVCKQGPFSWMLVGHRNRKELSHTLEEALSYLRPAAKSSGVSLWLNARGSQRAAGLNHPQRASLKTVCAVHIPHFAGRKAKTNPVSGAINRRASACAVLASEIAAFLPLGHILRCHDSKHDLSNAKGLCPSHPVSQNIESKA